MTTRSCWQLLNYGYRFYETKKLLAAGKILLPTRIVTKDNVADFQIELKNVLAN